MASIKIGYVREKRYWGGSRAPSPSPAITPPKRDDKAIEEAAAEALRRRRSSKGFRSTVLARDMMTDSSYTQALSKTLGS